MRSEDPIDEGEDAGEEPVIPQAASWESFHKQHPSSAWTAATRALGEVPAKTAQDAGAGEVAQGLAKVTAPAGQRGARPPETYEAGPASAARLSSQDAAGGGSQPPADSEPESESGGSYA